MASRFPPPDYPFLGNYAERHRAFLQAALTERALLKPFTRRRQLPTGYGVGLDERVVEYPWLLAKRIRGRVLDAGSTLNHAHVLDAFLAQADSLTIVTLKPEAEAYTERGVSYVYGDIRDLPFKDGLFDTVVSLSTLEHVGMDNSSYGSHLAVADNPDTELESAVRELRRVLKTTGELLVSVPYGAFEDHGWLRQFSARELGVLLGALEPCDTELEFFQYGAEGWRRSDIHAAADVSYRLPTDPPARDRVAAAHAVACIRARSRQGRA